MKNFSTALPFAFLITLFLSISACSGGGGGGSANESNADSTTDPLLSLQWHLLNTGQLGTDNIPAVAGEDINVSPVWASCGTANTCRGEGITVAVIDDGLEIAHEDLADNVIIGESHNYLNISTDPTPSDASLAHGTAVAGIIAARDENGLGGRGVAPRSQLVGYNLLEVPSTVNEADAMTRGIGTVDVSNNSWGPEDNLGILASSSFIWQTAIDNGITNGRSGLGKVYLWAAGNGRIGGDDSNYDGYANYRHVLAISAFNANGEFSSYSEPGANILISGAGGEFCSTTLAIISTDRTGEDGANNSTSNDELINTNYTQCMNGTSAATPSVAGAVALILQENPNLSWRDIRRILASTARTIDASSTDWQTNGAGFSIHPQYGFGALDTAAAVTAAGTWTNVPAQLEFDTGLNTVNQSIPDNNATGISDTINVSGSNINNIEFVEIVFSANDHTYAGDLNIELTSPAGTVSVLSNTHACRNSDGSSGSCVPFNNWTFGSVRHMSESADGNWQLRVIDGANVDIGTFQTWGLKFYGY